MHISKSRISPSVLSSMLIAFSALWFFSVYVFYYTNNHATRQSKDGIFGAPVWTFLCLTLVPLSTLLLGPWLLRSRLHETQRLMRIDYYALFAGAAPFVFIGVLLLKLFLSK